MTTPNDIERMASEMVEKNESVRANSFYVRPLEDVEVRVTVSEETQLDRIEKKLDSLLERKELSSFSRQCNA